MWNTLSLPLLPGPLYPEVVVLFRVLSIVIYWPSTEPSIKRCTCINKQKNSGSRWALNNNITWTQMVWVSWRQDANVRISLQIEPSVTHGRATSAKMRKKCCYGQKNWGQNSCLSPFPTNLSHTSNITLSRIKCEKYIFIKKCVCSFIEVRILCLIMFRIYWYMYVAIQIYGSKRTVNTWNYLSANRKVNVR